MNRIGYSSTNSITTSEHEHDANCFWVLYAKQPMEYHRDQLLLKTHIKFSLTTVVAHLIITPISESSNLEQDSFYKKERVR